VGDQVTEGEAFEPEIDDDELEGLADEDEDEEYGEDEEDGEDAWDQALINFPVEQDEVDLEQTPEEVKQAAALKLVRADQVSAGVEVEVEDAPDAVEGPARTYDDQLSALTVKGGHLQPAACMAGAAGDMVHCLSGMQWWRLQVRHHDCTKPCRAGHTALTQRALQ
jgi:hypothetical protein